MAYSLSVLSGRASILAAILDYKDDRRLKVISRRVYLGKKGCEVPFVS